MTLLQRTCINLLKLSKTLCVSYSSISTLEETVNIKGQTINYLRTGNGSKTLLLFPGALGTIWSDFKPQIEQLERTRFKIIAFDPPGYGGSRPPNRKFSIDFYENDADVAYEFMKEIGETKYSLLGWSDGGISSIILAGKRAESVENLIIWGSNAYVTKEELQIYDNLRDTSKWSDKMKAPLIKLYTENGLREMWNDWCNAIQEIYKTSNGDICKDYLRRIKSPTLILHGDKDPMLIPEHPDYLANHINGSKLVRFKNGKHNIHLRYAEEFNKLITDFILNTNKL